MAHRTPSVASGPRPVLSGRVIDRSGARLESTGDLGTVAGIVTDRDLVCRVLARHGDLTARVDAVMSSPVLTIDAGAEFRDAFPLFRTNAVRRLVVVDGGDPVGVLSVDDLLMDLVADLGDLVRPVTAETIFGHHDAQVPALPGT